MSKKNSSASLKNNFKIIKGFSKIYINFKRKLKPFKNQKFIVALSGGPDSLALTALSGAYKQEVKSKFFYVLINHNIRKNSSNEALKVKNLLKKNNIDLKIIKNTGKINKNIQKHARDVRYNLLTQYSLKKKIKIILTAHNLEDQVETFFIRLSRGSGLKGLAAMKSLTDLKNNIKVLRPLLGIKKKELIKIARTVYGTYIEDPSNKDLKFLRPRIRNLEKYLKKSGIEYDQIIKSINNLASSRNTLEEYFNNIIKNEMKKKGFKVELDIERFKKFNDEIKIKIINESIRNLRKNYYDPRTRKVSNLIKIIEDRKFKRATLGGCIFFREKDKLCVKIEKK